MDVARKRVAAAARPRLVVQDEGAERLARLDAARVPLDGRIAGLLVVVAAHDDELERLARVAPRGEALEGALRAPGGAMQEIPEENDLLRARFIDGAAEPFDILRGRSRRQRDPCAPEARRLAAQLPADPHQPLPDDAALKQRAHLVPRPRLMGLPCRTQAACAARDRRASRCSTSRGSGSP